MPWRRKSYEVLPALSVRRQELRRTLRTITLAYIFGVTWFTCVGGGQLKIFSRMAGFNDFDFGLMGALPFLATLGQVAAAVTIERTGLRKYQFIYWGVTHRLFWFVIAALPLLLPFPSAAAVWATLALLAMSWATNSLSAPAIWTWFGDLIPRRIRGRYMAYRERWGVGVQAVVIIAVSLVLDAVTVPGRPETPQGQPALLTALSVIFVIAAVLGTMDILLFARVRDVRPPMAGKPYPPAIDVHVRPPAGRSVAGRLGHGLRYSAEVLRQVLLEPMKDRAFRHYVLYWTVFTFSATVGGWFFWRQAMDGLGFSKLGANCLFLVVGPAASVLAARGWGHLIDRWGRRPVLILGTFGSIFAIAPWLFMVAGTPSPSWTIDALNWACGGLGRLFGRGDWAWANPATPVANYLLAMLGCIIGGSTWTGISLAQMGITLSFSDGRGRSKHVAAASVITSLGGILGGLAGGGIAHALEHLQHSPLAFGPFIWNNWQVTFAVGMVTRALSLAWLAAMPDPGAKPVRGLLRLLMTRTYSNMATVLMLPMRMIGRDRQGPRNKNGPPAT